MKKILTITGFLVLFAPVVGYAASPREDRTHFRTLSQMSPTDQVVHTVLGATPDASKIVMPRAVRPSFASVGFYDNLNEDVHGKSVTNAVLDRSIRKKIVRVHMNLNDPESYTNADRIDAMQRDRMSTNLAYVEEHCHKRFVVERMGNAAMECGAGIRGIKN